MGRQRCALLVAVCAAAVAVAGCATGAPRQRPLRTEPIAEGADTMEAARQRLQGRWTLASLNVVTQDGKRGAIEATGVLTFDAFGGMQIEYRMSEAGQKALEGLGIKTPNPVISTTGNVVIDPQQRRVTYTGEDFQKKAMGFDPDLAARRANPFALERTRNYDFGADGTLTLTSRYDNGAEASIGTWKKAQ